MKADYFLAHGPDMSHPLRETDLRVRMRLARKALPVIPAGRRSYGPVEFRV